MSKALIVMNQFIANPTNIDWLDMSNMYFNSKEAFNKKYNNYDDLIEIDAPKLAAVTYAFAKGSPRKWSIHTQHFGEAEYAEVMRAINVPGCRVVNLKLSMNSDMQGSEITPEMMIALVQGLKSAKQLRSFSLKNHFIDDEAAKILANALPYTSISNLDLSNCGIQKHGLQAILEAVPHTKLVCLDMHGTHYNRKSNNPSGFYGSMNTKCTRAALTAAKTSPCLVELYLPKDEFVFNANNRIKNGSTSWGMSYQSVIQEATNINDAQAVLCERKSFANAIANTLFGDKRTYNERAVEFLKNGGDQAVRTEYKNRLKFLKTPDVERCVDQRMRELDEQLAQQSMDM